MWRKQESSHSVAPGHLTEEMIVRFDRPLPRFAVNCD